MWYWSWLSVQPNRYEKYHALSSDAHAVIIPSLYAFGLHSLHVWQMSDHLCPRDMWYGPKLLKPSFK